MIEARLLTHAEACRYTRFASRDFNKLVREGKLPGPMPNLSPARWDKRSIDDTLDEMSGRGKANDGETEALRRIKRRNG